MKRALLDSFIWRGLYFVTTLVLNVCIARVYEANRSGWIYFISNNFYIVLLVGGLSLDSSMTYFAASKRIGTDKLALFSLSWPFLISFLSILCTAFLIYNKFITSDYLFLLVAGAGYTFGMSLINFLTSLFYAKHDFAVPNILMVSVNAAVILLIPFFAKGYFNLNLQHFLYVYFLQFIVQGFCLAFLFTSKYGKIRFWNYPDKQEYKMLFRFALIALSGNIAYFLINRIDYVFVEAWCSAKSLGNYVQVSKMGQLFLIIPAIIASAVYPQAAKNESTGAGVVKLILRLISLFMLLYIVIISGTYLIGGNIFLLLFGDTFDEMFVPFMILLPGIFFLSIHIIIAAYFGGKNHLSYNIISTCAGLAVVLAGDFLLIKKTGITGAAWVSSAGYFTAFVVSLFLFMKKTSSGWKDIFTAETFNIKTYTSLFANQSSNPE